jgi:type I restriction enzyme R subunit
MARLASERGVVQTPLIAYAQEVGWTYIPPEEALRLRRGETGIPLHDVLVAQLQRLNPAVVDLRRAEDLMGRLVRLPPGIEGNLQAWEYLIGLKTVYVETERRERNVRLLDPVNVEANTYHVTEEYAFTNGTHRIRPDVVFLINGLPVIVVEAKAATRREGIAEALEQIRRYHREGPELMSIPQLHALTHLVGFYYGATWALARKELFNWRDEQAGDFETLVKTFLLPRRVLRVLTDFILFTRKDEELQKVVLRPHQMRAVERVARRARDPQKRRGLVWHTQGSGKTYTMITVAKKLIEDPALNNPTVLLLVDRNELESQLFGNVATLTSTQLGDAVQADSKRHLVELLRTDRRGLILSMIHKFDDIPADINTRENIFVLVDEAHRTTGGTLGNYLMGALPNATYIGFTGTPIDKTAHGQGTFKVFGIDDPRGYLDKYSIRESIQDGTTVPLHYALAPNKLMVDRATLDAEFWNLAELEGVSDVEDLDRILKRAVQLKNMLKNRDRVEQVALHVAEHFTQTIEPMGYKAFLVAVDREACVLYKEALDRYLPPEYSRVVISHAHNDPPELARHYLSDDEEQAVRKAFRRPDELPKILIVTEKLLTGFDAPILYGMYLDKPMRDHVLLQAIARVNRPYEDREGRRKPAGFVLDFVGIFDKLEKALAFDSEEVAGVIEGVDVLQRRFAEMILHSREEHLPIVAGLTGDKAAEAVLEHFRDREVRQTFYEYFQELEELYEILSPDPFLRPYLRDYEELTQMYQLLRSAYDLAAPVDKSFLRKTAELVQENTYSSYFSLPRKIHVLDAKNLRLLVEEDLPDTVKIFNLVKALHDLVAEKAREEPYLIPIGERAEQIALAFEQRQLSTEEALRQLEEEARQAAQATEDREKSDLSPEAFAVYWFLRGMGVEQANHVARQVAAALQEYPHWNRSPDQARQVRVALTRALLAARIPRVADVAGQLMRILSRSTDD